MTKQLTSIEKKVLAVLQEGLPLSQRPYDDIAKQAGIDIDKLLALLKEWKKQGELRRIGAILNHYKSGFSSAAMVIWNVNEEQVEDVGKVLAEFEQVSHAYERQRTDNWPFNVYTMVHGKNKKDVNAIVEKMKQACGVKNFRILFTERELKKVPPLYIRMNNLSVSD